MTWGKYKGGNLDTYIYITWANGVFKCLIKRKDKYLHVYCKQFIISH